jgi:hypothetical protein
MPKLGDLADRLRAKNAGPFWLTLDIFCPDAASYARVRDGLRTGAVAALYDVPEAALKRFDIADLHVVKFSMPRPTVQGSRKDRDMHASQWAWLLADLEIA